LKSYLNSATSQVVKGLKTKAPKKATLVTIDGDDEVDIMEYGQNGKSTADDDLDDDKLIIQYGDINHEVDQPFEFEVNDAQECVDFIDTDAI